MSAILGAMVGVRRGSSGREVLPDNWQARLRNHLSGRSNGEDARARGRGVATASRRAIVPACPRSLRLSGCLGGDQGGEERTYRERTRHLPGTDSIQGHHGPDTPRPARRHCGPRSPRRRPLASGGHWGRQVKTAAAARAQGLPPHQQPARPAQVASLADMAGLDPQVWSRILASYARRTGVCRFGHTQGGIGPA